MNASCPRCFALHARFPFFPLIPLIPLQKTEIKTIKIPGGDNIPGNITHCRLELCVDNNYCSLDCYYACMFTTFLCRCAWRSVVLF